MPDNITWYKFDVKILWLINAIFEKGNVFLKGDLG